MRRLGWISFGLFLAAALPAHATIIATGGGPGITAAGFLNAFAADPFGTGVPINRDEPYNESRADANGNGSLPGSAFDYVAASPAEFDGENTVVGSSATANYSYSFFHLGGNLASGTMSLSAYSSVSIDESYFQGPDDYAAVRSVAQSINFMDLAISDVDYLFSFDGAVQNDNLQLQNGGGSAFFFVADITSGFDFLGLYSDATANDFASTAFSDAFVLTAGHQYRIGLGASTDAACAETPGTGLCPSLDDEGNLLDVLEPGLYSQSSDVNYTFTLTAVPEPGTATLVAMGMAVLARRRRG